MKTKKPDPPPCPAGRYQLVDLTGRRLPVFTVQIDPDGSGRVYQIPPGRGRPPRPCPRKRP